jgi:hypothetical protein
MSRWGVLLACSLLATACGGGTIGMQKDAASADAPGDGVVARDTGAGTEGGGGDAAPGGDGGGQADGAAGTGLAAQYPGDIGIESDPDVVWFEGFEEGSVAAVTARYEQAQNPGGMTLVADVPAGSGGSASLRLTAGVSANATDLYKHLPDYDEWYVRWYAKYQANVTWHHTGVWVGGYNPSADWPSPQAGLKPNGDDRFSISIEPVYSGPDGPRFDFYNYWMKMRSWMAVPSGDTAYYGNGLVHRNGFTIDEGQWVCLEVHVKVNPGASSGAGAVLEVWKNDLLVQRFDDAGPLGYWIRDKFCPPGADGQECTDYPAPADTILDLQLRSTLDLKLNAFWPQNYITEGPDGSVQYDHMVVATRYVGCLR